VKEAAFIAWMCILIWVGIDDPCLITGNNPVERVLSVSLVAGGNICIINYRTSNNMSVGSDIIME
jgi:energy-converting hydrogenase Eha subunit C